MQTIRQRWMFWMGPRAVFCPDRSISRPWLSAKYIDSIRLTFAFGIFLNLPFLLAPRLLHVSPRGIVNVEYLAVGVMTRLIRGAPAVPLLALVTTCDLVDRSIFVFYFSQRDLTSSLKYLSLVPLAQSLKMVAVFLVMAVALSWVALRIAPPSRIVKRGASRRGCI